MFLVLRQTLYTVQATVFVGGNVGRPMVQYAEDVSKESVVDVRGTVVVTPSPVSGCTQKEVELKIEEVCTHLCTLRSNPWTLCARAGEGGGGGSDQPGLDSRIMFAFSFCAVGCRPRAVAASSALDTYIRLQFFKPREQEKGRWYSKPASASNSFGAKYCYLSAALSLFLFVRTFSGRACVPLVYKYLRRSTS